MNGPSISRDLRLQFVKDMVSATRNFFDPHAPSIILRIRLGERLAAYIGRGVWGSNKQCRGVDGVGTGLRNSSVQFENGPHMFLN